MPDDYYTQADDGTPPDDESSPDESEQSEGKTTLVDNSFFGGEDKEVGSICKIRIVHKYNSESEIEYISHDGDKSSSPNMDEAEKSFDAMAVEEA